VDGRFVTHRSVTDGNIKSNLSAVSAGAIHFCQRDRERSEPQYIRGWFTWTYDRVCVQLQILAVLRPKVRSTESSMLPAPRTATRDQQPGPSACLAASVGFSLHSQQVLLR
jgi:hypothetical protein